MLTATAYGRLGRDPETRQTKTGNAMVTASMAVDVTPAGHDGDRVTQWLDLVAFGAAAELLGACEKGDMVAVIGALTLRPWVSRNGEERQSWGLRIDALHSTRTARPKTTGARSARARRSRRPAQTALAEGDDDALPFDDEIPF